MTVTAREALGHIQHALSTDQMPAVGGLRILNDAGNFVVSMHPWRWLEQAQSTLSLTSGQDYMWLPEDLREIVALVATDAINAGIHLTTLQEVAQKRGTTISSSLEYWAALAWVPRSTKTQFTIRVLTDTGTNASDYLTINDGSTEFKLSARNTTGFVTGNEWAWVGGAVATQAQRIVDLINSVGEFTFTAKLDPDYSDRVLIEAEFDGPQDADYISCTATGGNLSVLKTVPGRAGGAPMPRLEMWPTPATSKKDVFLVHYRGGWKEIRSDNDVINVPTWLEALYLAAVRAVALGYERDSEMDVNQRLFSLRSGPLFVMARQRDMMTQPTLGPLCNGAAEYQHGVNSMMWNYNSVTGPS